MSRNRIGAIQSAIGLITAERVAAFAFQVFPGAPIYAGDEITTGTDSAVTIILNDGTLVRLSSNTRAVLNEPDLPGGIATVSLSDERFRCSPAPPAEPVYVSSNCLRATLRRRGQDLGLRLLSLAVVAYALLRDIEHARALTTDDDTITPRDSEYGTFEIITKSGTVILVDDPALTYVVDDDGSVERRVNSSARMEELQVAQQAVLGTQAQGFAGAPGSGTPQNSPGVLDLQPLISPINFRPMDPVPERLISPIFTGPLEERPFVPAPPAPPPPPVPPVITTFTFDSGVDGDRITNNNALTLIGTATPGTIVSIYDGGAFLGSTTTDGSGSWSFETGPLPDGQHAFAAAAGTPSDTAAARSTFSTFALAAAPSTGSGPTSETYVVVIDTQAPDAPVISAGAGDGAENSASDATPTLTIAAEPGSIVHVYRNGTLAGAATETETPGIFTFESDTLSDGRYKFTATATDIANNTSRASCEFKVDIDATAPCAPAFIKLIDHSCCADENLTNDPTPTMLIAAEAGSTVRVYRDGVFAGMATETGKAGLFTYTSPELADGNHVFSATATDDAGNLGPLSDAFSVAVITSDPNDFDELATGKRVDVDPGGIIHGTRYADFIWFKADDCDPGRTIYAGVGNDYIKGTGRDDIIYAGSGNDEIFGNRGDDLIFGGFGDDKIDGGKGDDIIVGGYGADIMSGGKGCDTFVFLSEFDSLPCSRDTIKDFDRYRDKIDLSVIDADATLTGDQAFIFAGQTDSHSVEANSVSWYYDRHSDRTYILADTDGAADTAEIEIMLAGKVTLTHDNFVL